MGDAMSIQKRLTTDVLEKLQQELKRPKHSNSPQVIQFVRSMLGRHPELRA